MRTADIRPGVEYSTCNGALVVPVEPIHANWYRVFDAAKVEWVTIDGGGKPKTSKDPWGGCHRPTKAGQPAARRTKPGVLMDRYQVDRRGPA